ncbi:hypothetical protein TCDM_12289 [Trypanosoma cruzi Dm28c]|uniref:Uncharacterized protein n=2 Tax=Trypanosoma cruzi TaxID=5693 RepID=V5AVD2_TRYCR|nr:hypothetical protein TCDM_12289 [Trypanosoma cruzi Dm28c]
MCVCVCVCVCLFGCTSFYFPFAFPFSALCADPFTGFSNSNTAARTCTWKTMMIVWRVWRRSCCVEARIPVCTGAQSARAAGLRVVLVGSQTVEI